MSLLTLFTQLEFRKRQAAHEKAKYGKSFTDLGPKSGNRTGHGTPTVSGGNRTGHGTPVVTGGVAHQIPTGHEWEAHFLPSNIESWDDYLVVNLTDPPMAPQWRRLFTYREIMANKQEKERTEIYK